VGHVKGLLGITEIINMIFGVRRIDMDLS
jgi:hypothetical protein